MKNLKNVGAGPVPAQKEVIDNCTEFLKRSKQKNIGCSSVHSNFNGITLIALIITVIVMLILVGVTITVALKGGLFESATKAATETQKETERERLTEIALANYNVSEGKIASADDLAGKIKSSLGFEKSDKTTATKLVVKGKKELWQIDLTSAKVEPYTEGSTYTFTIGELGDKGLLGEDESAENLIPEKDFWREDASEKLKNSTITRPLDGSDWTTYNITCSDSSVTNIFDLEDPSTNAPMFIFAVGEGNIWLMVKMGEDDDTIITKYNYTNYRDVSFTISMAE